MTHNIYLKKREKNTFKIQEEKNDIQYIYINKKREKITLKFKKRENYINIEKKYIYKDI